MVNKVALAFVHGMGGRNPEFSAKMREMIEDALDEKYKANFVYQDIYWAEVFEDDEDNLINHGKINQLPDVNFLNLFSARNFAASYLADTVAYQLLSEDTEDNKENYERVHICFAETLGKLAEKAGGDAVLIVVAHSLGSVISSNFFYDRQKRNKKLIGKTAPEDFESLSPLEKGDTLAYFVTMGCPLAIYNLRYDNYGSPLEVPAPKLQLHYPGWYEAIEQERKFERENTSPLSQADKEDFAKLMQKPWNKLNAEEQAWLIKTEEQERKKQGLRYWRNYYASHDLIAFPLSGLNEKYRAIIHDIPIEITNPLTKYTPFAHGEYWNESGIAYDISTLIEDALDAANR